MKINEFIKNNLKVKVLNKDPLMRHMMTSTRLPHIVCTDGFTMSVQVGYSLYCKPKKVAKRYSEVEIGFPSDHEPLIEEYAECFTFEDGTKKLCRGGEEAVLRAWGTYPIVSAKWTGEEETMQWIQDESYIGI